LKLLIEGNKLIVRDPHTITELNTFSKKGKSYEAEPGKHDDMVMCLVIFSWLSDQQFFKEYTDTDINKMLREKTDEEHDADLLPFGIMLDGRDDEMDSEGFVVVIDDYSHW
jgi:hypothetical protein